MWMWLISESPQICKASWISSFANKLITLRPGRIWPKECPPGAATQWACGLPSPPPPPPCGDTQELGSLVLSGLWAGRIPSPTLRGLSPHIRVYGPFYCWLFVSKADLLWRRKISQPALVPAPWEMTGQIFMTLLRNGGGRGSPPLPSVWQRWG